MIRKYYILESEIEGGGGDHPTKPVAPKNYKATTPQKRSEWNGFLDYVNKQPNVNLDADPKAGANLINQYKKVNPNFSITPEDIGTIQYENYQLRKGDSFGNLKPEQLKYLRQGLPEAYLNRPIDTNGVFTGNTAKLYYPQKNEYGTDVESYVNRLKGTPISTSTSIGSPPASNSDRISLPNYGDPESRLLYAQSFTKKYGPLMERRGDAPLRVNDAPRRGTDSAKNLSKKSYGALGIDPALGYASAMEEGMSSEFPDKEGNYKYEESNNKDFPVEGSATYGLDNFVSRFPELVKKGYLPASFKSEFVPYHPADKNTTQDSALYKTADAALQAKAAFLKSNYDEVDEYVKKNNIKLSPRARDFFALANYNAGKGVGLQMIKDYGKNGYLKNDVFMENRPTKGEGLKQTSYGPTYDKNGKQTNEGVYTNVIRRIKMAEALKKEGLFD
jgi:hypothetical protein